MNAAPQNAIPETRRPRNTVPVVASVLVVTLLAASVLVLRRVDRIRGEATLEEVLYIPSARAAKRLSLGYTGLMADLYWTRVVQYFGSKHHAKSKQYQLLEPLLDITTTLDPQLLVAYEFGSIFLAQQPPQGAGDPEAAARLVERGIQNNPTAWRLYYHLGFIYWQEMKDAKRASEAFLKGSQVPGALPWMRIMAAALAQNAGEAETARYLWTNILNSTDDKSIKQNAIRRLEALRVDDEVTALQNVVDAYTQRTGTTPPSWGALISAGYLRGIPVDPRNDPYVLREGRVEVANPDDLPFITKGLPPGQEPTLYMNKKPS